MARTSSVLVFVFFFQAEHGIRDIGVTGVQTCALPIFIQELLHESSVEPNKHAYIDVIIKTIISTRRADNFIIAMCNLIQRLTIDSLHIVGDIYDRGPGAHIIMDTLCNYHNFDIQWGNHDILWMGAASGNDSCIANVIRISMRYGNLSTLEDGYGINLLPLATFAMRSEERRVGKECRSR